jgi:hypothetical protein
MFASLKKHLHAMLSGRFQTLSTGRVLSATFAAFTLVTLALVVWRMLGIHDPALLHEWTQALQPLGAVLFGLTGLPYSATKVTGSLQDLIGAIRKKEGE